MTIQTWESNRIQAGSRAMKIMFGDNRWLCKSKEDWEAVSLDQYVWGCENPASYPCIVVLVGVIEDLRSRDQYAYAFFYLEDVVRMIYTPEQIREIMSKSC